MSSSMWLSPARRFKCWGRTAFPVDIDMVPLMTHLPENIMIRKTL